MVLCSIKCQRVHRPTHKKECKKRAAELRDEILFKQPESSHRGDCPICCLPLSLGPKNLGCCCKIICSGCEYAHNRAHESEGKLVRNCPFCRHPVPKSVEEHYKNLLKRIEANDPFALFEMGRTRYKEDGDYKSAFQYWSKSAALGNMDAHLNLSIMYLDGEGVEKNEKKRLYHLEEAAIGGHPVARCNLAGVEFLNHRYDRAKKHWIIAANMGDDESLDRLKKLFKLGLFSKEDLASALRGHQSAVDATKSPQREATYAETLDLESETG
eukprot:scaffold59_cov144-Skeletonema_menzelii.AAC.4